MANPSIKRLLLLNQMAGPLFRELAEGLAEAMPSGCTLYTGEPETLRIAQQKSYPKLTVEAAPIYNRQSMVKRVLSWLTYTISAIFRIWRTPADTAIVVVSNPPIMAPVVWLICTIRNRRYIVLIYDIYPDIAVRMGFIRANNPLVWLWQVIHRKTYNKAAAVITIARHMADNVAKQFSPGRTPLGRVGILFPWADADKIKPLPRAENPLAKQYATGERMVVLYSGNMGISHDIESMLQAAKSLKHRDDIRFLFIGGGAKWQDAKDFQTEHDLSTVQVHPYVPEEQLPHSMALADICLVALDPGSEGMMIPSKLFYYLAAGAAVIGICGGDNDLQDVIERADCGLCIGHGAPDQLAKAIESLADDQNLRRGYSIRARQASIEQYTPQAGVQQFLNIMREADLDW